MNLQDLNQITTPEGWKQRALSQGDPAPARHPKAKKKLVLAFVVLLCLVLGGGTVLATEIAQHFQNPRVVEDTAALEQEIAAHAAGGMPSMALEGPIPSLRMRSFTSPAPILPPGPVMLTWMRMPFP